MQSLSNFLITKSNIYTLLSLLLSIVIRTTEGQSYEAFCDPEILYRPYLKYYDGRIAAVRHEKPFRIHGPGFHSDFMEDKLQNTYICMNGIVWLYYSALEQTASMYETPKLHIFHHHCMLVNPKIGPGPHASFKRLLAILLIGDPKDYRLPSMQLFYAPQKGGTGQPAYNASSLFIVGDETECTVQKGLGKDKTYVRLRTTPMKRDPDLSKYKASAGTFCKAGYTNFKENLATSAAVGKLAFRSDKMVALTKSCFVPENYTDSSTVIDTALEFLNKDLESTNNADRETAARATKFKLYSGDFAQYFERSDRIPSADKQYWPAKCPSASECRQSEIDKKVAAEVQKIKTSNPNASPPEKRELINTATLKMKLANCMDYAFAVNDVLKTIKADALVPWNAAKAAAGPAYTTFKEAQRVFFEAEAKFRELSLPLTTEVQDFEKAQATYFAAETAYLEQKDAISLAVAAGRTYVEKIHFVLESRAESAYENLVRQYKVGKRGGKVTCPEGEGDEVRYLPSLVLIRRPGAPAAPADPAFGALEKIQHEMAPVDMPYGDTIRVENAKKDPTKYEEDLLSKKTCGYIPTLESVCKAAKPDGKRACQLLEAMMGSEAGVGIWETEDEWRQEVLDLIEMIYISAVTPTIDVETIQGVSNVIKAYFTGAITGTVLIGNPKATGRRKKRHVIDNYEDDPDEAYAVFSSKKDPPTRSTDNKNAAPVSKEIVNTPPKSEQDIFMESYLGEVIAHVERTKKQEQNKAAEDALADASGKDAGKDTSSPNKTSDDGAATDKKEPDVNGSVPDKTSDSDTAASSDKQNPDSSDTSNDSGNSNDSAANKDSVPADDKDKSEDNSINSDDQGDSSVLNDAPPPSDSDIQFDAVNKQPIMLPPRRQFWPMVIQALNECKDRKFKIYLQRTHNQTHENYLVYRKKQPHQGEGFDLVPVIENIEQADQEYAFNWAIDMNFFMFATVLGVCMPAYENKIPLISARFYSLYTEDFLVPLSTEWIDPRDNSAYQLLGGEFYNSLVPKMFMEASFVASSQTQYRPPRKLLVNDRSEANFFVRGRFSGSLGHY